MLTQNGPGGRGSIPALVMRTGLIQPVDPANARRDIQAAHVRDVTHWPTDQIPSPDGMDSLPPPIPQATLPMVTPLIPAAPSPVTTAVTQTVTATPPQPITATDVGPPPRRESDRHHWHMHHRRMHPMAAEIQRLHPSARLHGVPSDSVLLGEWNGKPVAKFEIAASPPVNGAQGAAQAMRDAARALVQNGLSSLPPELVGGPLSALMRGGAIEMHFQNGVVVRTAL